MSGTISTKLFPSKSPCTNCNLIGHHYRNCVAPVYSFGIIAFRHKDSKWNQVEELSKNDTNFTGFKSSDIEFLLIQRKDSIGYIEIIRGKYKNTDLQYIKDQISGTTQKEREKLLTMDFNDLWHDLWGEENQKYRHDHEQARLKLDELRAGIFIESINETVTLQSLFDCIPCAWDTPEWGFPKGRRNPNETDYDCASREFREETGLMSDQFRIFENMDPIRETFFGNNHIQYCHVYYIGWIPSSVKLNLNKSNKLLCQEVSNIGWFSLEDALTKIRSTNIEKREILLRASTLLRNMSCLLIGPILGQGQNLTLEAANYNRRDGDSGDSADKIEKGRSSLILKKAAEGNNYQFLED